MKKNIVIGVLVTTVVMLVAFIILIKLDVIRFSSKNQEQKSDKSVNQIEKKISKEEVNALIDKYTKTPYIVNVFKNINLTEEVKTKIAYTNLNESDFIIVDCSEYSEELVYDPMGVIKKEKEMVYRDSEHLYCYENSFKYATINSIYHDLFGNSTNFPKEDFRVGLSKYKYSTIKDRFEEYVILGGIEYANVNVYSVIDYEFEDNNLIVNLGYASYIFDFGEGYVPEIEKMRKYTEEEINDKSNYSKIIDDNIGLVEKYTFTFFEEDGLYKLSKIEKR